MRRMSTIDTAIEHFGTQQAMAAAIGVKQSTVSEWKKGDRPIPERRCVQIEQGTNGQVRRWHLRPDDWHLIWPELIDQDGAPKLPLPKAA